MNRKILFLEVIAALAIVWGFSVASKPTSPLYQTRQQVYQNRFMVQCSPDWNLMNADSLGATMVPLPGWGNYRWNIQTSSDSALFYFNQGINMYYAFHIIESMASFKKAATFDSTNGMIYWAQALAYGPNINDYAYAATPDAVIAVNKAVAYSGSLGAREKALIQSMTVRYTADSTISRASLNQAYADAMKALYEKYNRDADVGALYADALMLQHPWEYWQHNGKAQPWTPEILSVLEHTLSISPDHPGANHYYIHSSEASPNPGRAMASANRLGVLMPGVSHMIHMPSHIFIRTGLYQRGVEVNKMSVLGYDTYKDLYPEVTNNAPLYLIHNMHMYAACTLMMADYQGSVVAAEKCRNSFDTSMLSLPQPFGNILQYIYQTPVFTDIRFEHWNEILARPVIDKKYAFGYVLDQWSRGLAYAHLHQPGEAKKMLASLQSGMQHADLQVENTPFSKPFDQITVGEKILQGMIAIEDNKLKVGINFLREAVVAEDKLIYTEPRDWLIPARYYLSKALILSKQYKAAEKSCKEDLFINPNNYHSLLLLKQIYTDKKDIKNLDQVTKQLSTLYPR